MKHDEFAFFNEQLANMLRDGIPLERAIAQLCRDLRGGGLAAEMQALGSDLARGTPLAQALAARGLPDLYVQMLRVGAAANNLPTVLRLLADHYRRVDSVWTRLKGILFYPFIVLLATIGISLFVALFLGPRLAEMSGGTGLRIPIQPRSVQLPFGIEVPVPSAFVMPALLGVVAVALAVAVWLPRVRRWLRWRVSPFKEASLSQLASGIAVMLRGGCPLREALELMRGVEQGTLAALDLARMSASLAEGHGRQFADLTAQCETFPRLFTWMVENSGEDLAGGMEKAAELFRARANHRTEMLLYAALPCSLLLIGGFVMFQVATVLAPLISLMQGISGGFCW